MLGVVSCLSINEDMNWLQAFRPSVVRKGESDLNDIGALNIEGNIETILLVLVRSTTPRTSLYGDGIG